MGELICSHCGKEVGYAEAANAKVKGDTCPENTETETFHITEGYGDNAETVKRESTRELQHNWINPDSWDNTPLTDYREV